MEEEAIREKEVDEVNEIVEKEVQPKLTDIPGIGPGIAAKLDAAGVYDLMGLAVMSPPALSDMAGVGEAVARKAIQAARNMLNLGFMDASDFAKKRESVLFITTGSENLNNLLGGKGVETGALTEAYGAYGSGKTQLALSLAVNTQLPREQGGAGGKAVYIDTEGTFRPERIRQIAEGMGADPEKVLKNVLVARAFNSDHQILLMDKISEMIKLGEPIRLIIIDSLTAHFRAEFAGRGQLADRQQKLNRYMHNLIRMSEQHNVAVYVTNQVMANPAMMFGDPTTAVGGNIVGHACLTGDSLIQTGDGSIVEIKNIKKENVLSGNFSDMNLESANSEQVFVNSDVKDIYNIKTNCQINCSPLHRFFTIDNFEVIEKEVKDLKKGDFVAQAGKINILGRKVELPRFKVKKIAKLTEESSNNAKKELAELGTDRKEICGKIGVTPRQFRRVLNQGYSTDCEVLDSLNDYFAEQGRQLLQVVPVLSYKHRDLMVPEVMTSQFSQLLGYFIGDGGFEERGLRFRDARVDVLQNYKILFKQVFNIEGTISKVKDKNCHSLNINSKEVRDFFELILEDVYSYVGKGDENVVRSFIKGFFDAEGHADKKRAYVSVSQKNDRVLRYLQLFLLRFGIRATIKFNIGRKKINVLRITDKDVIGYLQIGFTAEDKQRILFECAEKCKETYSYEMMPVRRDELRALLENCGLNYSKFIKPRTKDYLWVNRKELKEAFKGLMDCEINDRQIKQKIVFIGKLLNGKIRFEKIREMKIERNDGQILYDFSVPSKENYIANGFIVHNSTYRMYLRRGKQGSRVAKLIDSPNLPDNECQFYVTTKGVKDEEE